ncbi:MAG: RecX family transcriptional regulator [Dehalococcoidia bacterium]|nr:MAG: RecX family transcriptional regulator [Dehalococcoidia bacterium]
MSKVTAIRAGRGQGKRVNLFLDGRFAFSLQAELAAKEELKVGQELSPHQVKALTGSDNYQRGYDAATRYLSYRPRSEAELKEQLCRRGFDNDCIEAVTTKLKEQGLVDDLAFAQFWRDNRQSFSPRSQWLTRRELRQKGIAEEVMNQVVATIDDSDSAYRAALGKARRLSGYDYPQFRQRLGSFLRRRGFNYAVINHTVAQMWTEEGDRTN